MTNSALLFEAAQFEQTALGKELRAFLQKEYDDKIVALIAHGKQSTDPIVARICWALDTDARMMKRVEELKQEFESKQSPPSGETPDTSAYPGYTAPDITIDREMEYTP